MRPLVDPIEALALQVAASPGAFAIFVGSGVSHPNVPTGQEVLERTLAQVYSVGEGHPPDDGTDLRAWWRARGGDERYSAILDQAFPSAESRREYLAAFFAGAMPTETHQELARLAKRGLVRVFVTTNFDHLLERALEDEGLAVTVVSTPEQIEHAAPRERAGAFVLKLHGDYATGRIKNTADELATLDAAIDAEFRDIARRYGLIVLGYAGLDAGVSAVLTAVPQRFGFYWVVRGDPATLGNEFRGAATVITAEGAAEFVRDLVRRIDALAAHPDGRMPLGHFREVAALLRSGDVPAVERRARTLGRRLRDVAKQTIAAAANRAIPGAGDDLASWENTLAITYRPMEPALREILAAATAAIEQDHEVGLRPFLDQLRELWETPSDVGGSSWVTEAPQLVAVVGLNVLLARCVALGRWSLFAAILQTHSRSRDDERRGSWPLLAECLHPSALADNASVAGQLIAQFLRADELNAELQIDGNEAIGSAKDASVLLGVVDRASRPNDTMRYFFYGFVGGPRREFVRRLASNPVALDLVAPAAGENAPVFRAAFRERLLGETGRMNEGRFPPLRLYGLGGDLAAISGPEPRGQTTP
jgi:SIR2-like domain